MRGTLLGLFALLLLLVMIQLFYFSELKIDYFLADSFGYIFRALNMKTLALNFKQDFYNALSTGGQAGALSWYYFWSRKCRITLGVLSGGKCLPLNITPEEYFNVTVFEFSNRTLFSSAAIPGVSAACILAEFSDEFLKIPVTLKSPICVLKKSSDLC